MRRYFKHNRSAPGTAPGIEHDEIADIPCKTGEVCVTCMDYGPGQVSIREIDNIEDFVNLHRPEWTAVRWISIEGLSDLHVIKTLATKYDLHSTNFPGRSVRDELPLLAGTEHGLGLPGILDYLHHNCCKDACVFQTPQMAVIIFAFPSCSKQCRLTSNNSSGKYCLTFPVIFCTLLIVLMVL